MEASSDSETRRCGESGQHLDPSSGSTRQTTTRECTDPTGKSAGNDEQIHNRDTIPGLCTEAKTGFQQSITRLSPGTFHRSHDIDQKLPSSPPESSASSPEGFIPAISQLRPHELALDHYNCPVSGCGNPHGPFSSLQGYHWMDLGPHIYFRHGLGPGVDAVRLNVRQSVVALQYPQRKDIGLVSEPYTWTNPMRDLQRATWDLVSDLEEIRNWERSLRSEGPLLEGAYMSGASVSVGKQSEPLMEDSTGNQQKTPEVKHNTEGNSVTPESGEVISPTRVAERQEVLRKMSPDTSKRFDSFNEPHSQCRSNRFARLRDNRFHRPRESSLLHVREVIRSPPKKQRGDIPAGRVDNLLQDGRKIQTPDESDKENWEPTRNIESMECSE